MGNAGQRNLWRGLHKLWSEAPRGPDSKRSGRGIFAEPCDLSAIAPGATAEAKSCGNLLRPRGYEGQEPQGFLAKKGKSYWLIWTVLAGGKPLNGVDEATL